MQRVAWLPAWHPPSSGAVYGVTDFVFLVLIGLPIPLAAPLSVLVFMGSFIPYLGGVVTTVILLLVTYGALGSTATIVLFALMAVRNVIVSNFCDPSCTARPWISTRRSS